MGQKINPIGFRLGIMPDYDWRSRWFADKKRYRQLLLEDIKIRKFLMEKLKLAGILCADIERSYNRVKIFIHVTRPGVVIGRGGTGLELLKKALCKIVDIPNPNKNVVLQAIEVKDPDLHARLVALRIADQLVKRMPYRQVVERAMQRVMETGAKGIKVNLGGRVAGAEISRVEKYHKGTVPLSTLRAKIDYAQIPALTRSGYIGVKVWIHKI